MRTNLTTDTYRRFLNKKLFHCGKIVFFGLFSRDTGNKIDMWMIKIAIKTNQIDMGVLLISKVDNIRKPRWSLKSGFSHKMVCAFHPHGYSKSEYSLAEKRRTAGKLGGRESSFKVFHHHLSGLIETLGTFVSFCLDIKCPFSGLLYHRSSFDENLP